MTIHIIITMVLLLAFLLGSIWYAKKKYQINLAVLGLGAVAFFVSSQILEKLVHILVLHPQKDGSICLLYTSARTFARFRETQDCSEWPASRHF